MRIGDFEIKAENRSSSGVSLTVHVVTCPSEEIAAYHYENLGGYLAKRGYKCGEYFRLNGNRMEYLVGSGSGGGISEPKAATLQSDIVSYFHEHGEETSPNPGIKAAVAPTSKKSGIPVRTVAVALAAALAIYAIWKA